MARITVKNIEEKNVWEKFVLGRNETNFLQSWDWGEFHKALGKEIQRTGFFEGEKLAGVMLSVIEPARRGKYLTVPGGPLIDWSDKELITSFIDQIKNIARQTDCVFVRVRPQLKKDELSEKIFKNL